MIMGRGTYPPSTFMQAGELLVACQLYVTGNTDNFRRVGMKHKINDERTDSQVSPTPRSVYHTSKILGQAILIVSPHPRSSSQ